MTKVDVAVVGAGIVGLAVTREVLLRRPGASVAVVEKEPTLAAHQTSHNSGVVHSGIYYEPGSLKARLCVEGATRMYEYAQEHRIEHERCGKLIVAVREADLPGLAVLEQRGIANGVPGLRRIGAGEIRDVEPNATGLAALHAPGTGIIDYAAVAEAIRGELERQDVAFHFDTKVRRVVQGSPNRIDTGHDPIYADQVITCAGLWSDRLARRSGSPRDPRIVPFRGRYLRLQRSAEPLVRGMVYPVPDPSLPFLGVHVTKDVHGDVLLGPTAMLVPSRDGYRFGTFRPLDVWETISWPGSWRMARQYWRTGISEIRLAMSTEVYVRTAAQYLPGLTLDDLDGTFHAGVRAQALARDGSLLDDFVLSHAGAISHVRNAPSPAATSAFALARELVDRIDAP